jgi:hypothetical protein
VHKLKLYAPDCLLEFASGLCYEFSAAPQLNTFWFAAGLILIDLLLHLNHQVVEHLQAVDLLVTRLGSLGRSRAS